MKKLFSFILVVMMFSVIAGTVYADVIYSRSSDARISVYVAVSTAALGGDKLTTIATVNRVLGFSYSNSAAGSVGLYDESSIANLVANTTTHLFGETTVAAGAVSTVMFPLPYQVQNGVVIHTSSTTGVVNIFYE